MNGVGSCHAVGRLPGRRESEVGVAFGWHDITTGTRPVSPNGEVPGCHHADDLLPVVPSASVCRECTAAGTGWAGLCICLTCGWVACCERSAGRHAFRHYEETDHPVAARLEPGAQRRWCYVHRRII
ncbi:MAG: hypothetical protein GEV11_19775 [Streptosporangiales bacterium]|nr:hypothetical protein [Streptosporangiales bacterium]